MSGPLLITMCGDEYVSISFIYSCSSAFDFAFSIAKVALKGKVADIHLKKALHLEDEVDD